MRAFWQTLGEEATQGPSQEVSGVILMSEHGCEGMPDGYKAEMVLYGDHHLFAPSKRWMLLVSRSVGPKTKWESAMPTDEIIKFCPFCGEELYGQT